MTAWQIRNERDADFAGIDSVHDRAFGQPEEGRLVRVLREQSDFDPQRSLVAVIEDTDTVAGHVLFTRIRIEAEGAPSTPAQALAPLAVLPEYHRQGIGTDLVRAGLARCAEQGHRIVIVLGDPAYYGRFGFGPAEEHGIQPPFKVKPSCFMALEVQRGGLDGVSGTVRYPSAFDDV